MPIRAIGRWARKLCPSYIEGKSLPEIALGEAADAPSRPDSLDVRAELERRQQKLANLAQAEAVLQARAEERYQLEQAGYEVKMAERAARQYQSGRKPSGPVPKPPF